MMVRFQSYRSVEHFSPIPRAAWMALPLLLFPSTASVCQTEAARPHVAQNKLHLEDGSGAYATGKYRNLFAETGHSSTAIQQKIDAAYQQLFHGDPQSQAIFFSVWPQPIMCKRANSSMLYGWRIFHRGRRATTMACCIS
jgi:hypothetical protein